MAHFARFERRAVFTERWFIVTDWFLRDWCDLIYGLCGFLVEFWGRHNSN